MLIAIAVCFLLAIGITIYLRQRKRNTEKEYQMEIKVRNHKLDELLNSTKYEKGEGESPCPYKVDYHPIRQRIFAGKDTFFQLIEKNRIAERKYLFSKEEEVYIGVRANEAVVLIGGNQRETVCKIYSCQDQVCIKALTDVRVILRRKRQQTLVKKDGIILKDHDAIKVMDSEFIVLF